MYLSKLRPEISGMKIALRGAKVWKKLDVLLNLHVPMLNLFSTVFSNAIIECYSCQKDLLTF